VRGGDHPAVNAAAVPGAIAGACEPVDVVAQLDPIGFDPIAQQLPKLIADKKLGEILRHLRVAAAQPGLHDDPVVALAALRDLEFLLTVAHFLCPHSYKSLHGLEARLLHLGRVARHAPRGSVFTYGVCNPLDARMRTFTGTDEERLFIRGLHAALLGLDDVLKALSELSALPIDSADAAAHVTAMHEGWEPMVTAVVEMRRHMPPELFSGRIVPFFGSLDIAGHNYDGNTGAHMPTVAIDWILHGAESADPTYRRYVEHNLAALRPHQRRWVDNVLPAADSGALLSRLKAQIAAGVRNPAQAASNMAGLQRLLARVGAFRKVHLRLAADNLPLRPSPTGSGGHDLSLLEDLTDRTHTARHEIQDTTGGRSSDGPVHVPHPREPSDGSGAQDAQPHQVPAAGR
jgi:monodechloroaminopyrrolnitrin synthase